MLELEENLADVFVFVKVVESKSFSEAARLSGSTKSTVSKRIRRLEGALGAKLLNRTTRHLGLTEAGQAVYEHSVRIVEQTLALRNAVDGMQATPRGLLRVSTSVAFGNLHLTGMVAEFLHAYPDVNVALTLSDRYVDVVDEGFDIAIRLTSKPVETFVARRLADLKYVVCASPGYLEQHAPIVTVDNLRDHQCILNAASVWCFHHQGGTQEVQVAMQVAVQVAGRLSVNSSESLRVAVLAGLGVALLPTFAVADDVRQGRLQVVLPELTVDGPFGNSIYAVFPASQFVAPKMRVFVDFLAARFAHGTPWTGVA